MPVQWHACTKARAAPRMAKNLIVSRSSVRNILDDQGREELRRTSCFSVASRHRKSEQLEFLLWNVRGARWCRCSYVQLIVTIGKFVSDCQDRHLTTGARRSSREVMTRDDTNLLRLLFDVVPLSSVLPSNCVLPLAARALTCSFSFGF